MARSYPGRFATAEEVGKLDLWWVANVLLPPRDEKGRLEGIPKEPGPAPKSQKEFFSEPFRKKDYPEWIIEEKWAEIAKKIPKTALEIFQEKKKKELEDIKSTPMKMNPWLTK